MRSSKVSAVLAVSLTLSSTAFAARVDFSDPRRSVGREDNVRVDAQLISDTVTSGSPITVTYQIENFGSTTVAVADKVAVADYDLDSQTITMSIGAEIPTGPAMPHMTVVRPGEKRVMTIGALARIPAPALRTPATLIPRFVEVKVTLLRDVVTFADLIEKQSVPGAIVALPDSLFDKWVEGSASVYLNAIPVRWKPDSRLGSAESRGPSF